MATTVIVDLHFERNANTIRSRHIADAFAFSQIASDSITAFHTVDPI